MRDPAGSPNAEPNYKWLGEVLNDARLSGLLDWRYIEDRTRSVAGGTGSDTDPVELIEGLDRMYGVDKWLGQLYHVEVWVEKQALENVVERACPPYEVNSFSCRGYTSQSAMWRAACRLVRHIEKGKRAVVIHLGDHDPSGIDMSRDIEDRLAMFIAQDHFGEPPGEDADYYREAVEGAFELNRIALNMDQIRAYDPPPNPAKVTDSRAAGYIQRFGDSSWELDALEPAVLVELIGATIEQYRDRALWDERVEREVRDKRILVALREHWTDVAEYITDEWPEEVGDDEA